MDRHYLSIGVGLTLFGLSIIASTFFVTNAIQRMKFGPATLHVKGCAEKEIHSDFATWQGSVSVTDSTQLGAFEKLEKDLNLLQSYLKEQKIPQEKITYSPIVTQLHYKQNDQGHATNTVESMTLTQDFSIASPDIKTISALSLQITQLIKEGLNISSQPPKYFYLKIDELKIAMLGDAADDAKQRAKALLGKGQGKVGALRSAQQGIFQITPLFSNSFSDYGEYDTSSIHKKIKAVVTMDYCLE